MNRQQNQNINQYSAGYPKGEPGGTQSAYKGKQNSKRNTWRNQIKGTTLESRTHDLNFIPRAFEEAYTYRKERENNFEDLFWFDVDRLECHEDLKPFFEHNERQLPSQLKVTQIPSTMTLRKTDTKKYEAFTGRIYRGFANKDVENPHYGDFKFEEITQFKLKSGVTFTKDSEVVAGKRYSHNIFIDSDEESEADSISSDESEINPEELELNYNLTDEAREKLIKRIDNLEGNKRHRAIKAIHDQRRRHDEKRQIIQDNNKFGVPFKGDNNPNGQMDIKITNEEWKEVKISRKMKDHDIFKILAADKLHNRLMSKLQERKPIKTYFGGQRRIQDKIPTSVFKNKEIMNGKEIKFSEIKEADIAMEYLETLTYFGSFLKRLTKKSTEEQKFKAQSSGKFFTDYRLQESFQTYKHDYPLPKELMCSNSFKYFERLKKRLRAYFNGEFDPNANKGFYRNIYAGWKQKLRNLKTGGHTKQCSKTEKEYYSGHLAYNKPNYQCNCHQRPNYIQERDHGIMIEDEKHQPEYELRDTQSRCKRFIEMLITINGIFLKRFTLYPEEKWNWQKYDVFVLAHIDLLLTDEFMDGELTKEAMDYKTIYSTIKSWTEKVKHAFHTEQVDKFIKENCNVKGNAEGLPFYMENMIPIWLRASQEDDESLQTFAINILKNKRCVGQPPSIDTLTSKKKFLETITAEPEPFADLEKSILSQILTKIGKEIPAHAVSGLATRAKVKAATSATLEQVRSEGGGKEFIRQLLTEGDKWKKDIPIIDLNNEEGKVKVIALMRIGEKKGELSLGEGIFWLCIERFIQYPLKHWLELEKLPVKDAAKVRIITKSHMVVKVILDVCQKLIHDVLAKAFDECRSGMKMEAQMWQFFKRSFRSEKIYQNMFQKEGKEFSHQEDQFYIGNHDNWQTKGFYEGHRNLKQIYKKVGVLSIDYECATDAFHHGVGSYLGDFLAKMVGFPIMLQKIIQAICYNRQTVFFLAKGALKGIGTPVEQYDSTYRVLNIKDEQQNKVLEVNTDREFVTMKTGIPMGNPMTKAALTLLNLSLLRMGDLYESQSLFENTNDQTKIFTQRLREKLLNEKIGNKPYSEK